MLRFAMRVGAAGTSALVAAFLLVTSAGASGLTATKTYVAPLGDAVTQVYDGVLSCNSAGVGSVCFDVRSGPDDDHPIDVTITITDQTGMPVPARVFFGSDGSTFSQGPVLMCGKATIAVVTDQTFMDVRPGVFGRGSIPVPPTAVPDMACGQPEAATTGTVTVTGPALRDTKRVVRSARTDGLLLVAAMAGLR